MASQEPFKNTSTTVVTRFEKALKAPKNEYRNQLIDSATQVNNT